jgi:hypothetical protein
MIKKAPGKTAEQSVPKKRTSKTKQVNAAQVYEQIAETVREQAPEIAQALIDRALNGDPAAAKYLFELARIFPSSDETNAGAKEEESLAKTLMHRLNLPEEPIKMDEDDGKVEDPVPSLSNSTSESRSSSQDENF